MRCKRCNRPLTNEKSVELGFGLACHKKHRKELADAEFERLQITIFEVMQDGDTGAISETT